MILKSRDISADAELVADVCIVGSGPASLSIAHELLGHRIGVIILESGGLDDAEGAESLGNGVVGRNPDFNPYHLRRQRFAGTSVTWSHRIETHARDCRFGPLDAIDFEAREWFPHSGWPMSRADLDPFYRRAHALLGLGPFDYDGSAWETPGRPSLRFPDGNLHTTVFQFASNTVFLDEMRQKLTDDPDIRVCLNSTAAELETDETASNIRRVRVATLAGGRFWVKAKLFVLASGGIENPRLLLLSDQHAPGGLGNRHDNVGRYFNDHYQVSTGYLIPPDRQIFDRLRFFDLHLVNDIGIQAKLSLSDRILRREHLLNSAIYLLPRHPTARIAFEAGNSMAALRRAFHAPAARNGTARAADGTSTATTTMQHLANLGKWPIHVANSVYRRILRKPLRHPWIAFGGWSDLPNKSWEFRALEVSQLVEQTPHPDNRVTLSTEIDPLGRRLPRVDCTLHEIDWQSMMRTAAILREEFARNGLGKFLLYPNAAPRIYTTSGSAHHAGTTRMHQDPKLGVVDADCRVHDLDNLYIAGCSVFPTGGYVNPTLTIIALAMRLADRIKAVFPSS